MIVVAVPRMPMSLLGDQVQSGRGTMTDFIGDVWADTAIGLPDIDANLLQDQFTGKPHSGTRGQIELRELFSDLCFAVLKS